MADCLAGVVMEIASRVKAWSEWVSIGPKRDYVCEMSIDLYKAIVYSKVLHIGASDPDCSRVAWFHWSMKFTSVIIVKHRFSKHFHFQTACDNLWIFARLFFIGNMFVRVEWKMFSNRIWTWLPDHFHDCGHPDVEHREFRLSEKRPRPLWMMIWNFRWIISETLGIVWNNQVLQSFAKQSEYG